MYIKYSMDGDCKSFSNNARKSMNAFANKRDFISISNVKFSLMHKNIPVCLFDIDSMLHKINLDCEHCDKNDCDSLYPLEFILDVDDNFNIIKMYVFCNYEDTRLISYYGKHGHLNHCVDDNLNDKFYYKGSKCDKKKSFKHCQYDFLYIKMEEQLKEIFGNDIYDSLCNYFNDDNKIGKLF